MRKTQSPRRNPSRLKQLGGLGLVLERLGGSPRRGPTSRTFRQAAPRAVHEDALRKFLRWLVGCPLLDQIFPCGDGTTLEEENAALGAFCDSNWGSESSTGRKSTSGGVVYVVAGSSWYCVKGYIVGFRA